MKRIPAFLAALAAAGLVLAPQFSRAAIIILPIDISPMGGAANLGTTTYTRDHAIGLSGLNEPGMFAGVGTGNEVGSGITYEDVSNNLAFDFAYGSTFGFTDLVGDFTAIHIHGTATGPDGLVNYPDANTGTGVQENLASFHTPSDGSGRVTGAVTLDAAQETMLFDNRLYINIHSSVQTGGEIRGQLIVVPEPGTASLAILSGAFLFFRRRRT